MSNTRVIDEFQFGVYIAKTSDGKYITNQDGDLLNIVSRKNDQKRLSQLSQAARHIGFENITWEFRSGARRITEDEFQEQLERRDQGKIPDPYDLGVLVDEYKKGMAN